MNKPVMEDVSKTPLEQPEDQVVQPQVTDHDPGLVFVWAQYKTWDVTSNRLKKTLSGWRKRVFILIIVGSFTALLGENFAGWGLELFSRGSGVISALAIALAAYATTQVITDEAEKNWVRSRAAAEAFKSEAYLYQQKAPPYHEGNETDLLFERTEGMIKAMSDVSSLAVGPDEQREQLPDTDMPFEHYIQERIYDQAYHYYLPKTRYFQKLLLRGKNWAFALGFFSIILGTLSASGFNEFSVWIAFISSTAAAITTYMSTNRYQYLVISYQATANRLMMILARSSKITPGDTKTQQQFVAECEAAIALENNAWITELSEEKKQEEAQTNIE